LTRPAFGGILKSLKPIRLVEFIQHETDQAR
jgi:hypothetical protein